MFFTKHRQLVRWIIIIASFGIISLILWNTYVFFQKFKEEERRNAEKAGSAPKKDAAHAEGPIIDADQRDDVVGGQDEGDDLLSSLGF